MATGLPGDGLVHDARGAAMSEYVVLVGVVGLVVMAALLVVGPKLVKDYSRARDIVAAPTP
jgi:Flp pilus assembly pilin Flp